MADLQAHVLLMGRALPVVPGTAQVTVGGAIAADVHGKNPRAGSFARQVAHIQLRTLTGDVLSGPGDDVFAATGGGMGLTGAVLQATVQLVPARSAWLRVDTDRVADLDGAMALLADSDHEHVVAWLDLLGSGRGVVTRADEAPPEELPPSARRDPLRSPVRSRVEVPGRLPTSVVRRPLLRAYNALRLVRAPKRERGHVMPRASVLHPVDGLGRWDRLYGPQGFVQYQFAVSGGAPDVLGAVVALLRHHGVPMLLAVLKRLGDGAGLVAFPRPGWTLAIDLPPVRGLGAVLDACDEVVAGAGGRVYLAKDARL